MPPSWPCSSSCRCSSSRCCSGACSAGRSSIEHRAARPADGGAGGGGRAVRRLPVLLDGRDVAEDGAGDPATAAAGVSRPLEQPRQLSRGLPASALRPLPAQQRAGRLGLRAVERDRVVAGRLRLLEVPLPRSRRALLRHRRHPHGALPVRRGAALPVDQPARAPRHLPGILAPDLVSVFGVFLMRQSIEVVPTDYVDAARIDGASEFGIFWRVILPAVKPAIATLVIVKFIW